MHGAFKWSVQYLLLLLLLLPLLLLHCCLYYIVLYPKKLGADTGIRFLHTGLCAPGPTQFFHNTEHCRYFADLNPYLHGAGVG